MFRTDGENNTFSTGRPLQRPHIPQAHGTGWGKLRPAEDGGEFPVEIGLQPISTPEGTFVLASVIDITERKQAEAELRASEELARSILNAITAHIAVLDRQGNIVAVNSSWERLALANSQASVTRSWVGAD